MKSFTVRFGLARSLVALVVSFALALSTFTLAIASPATSAAKSEGTRSLPRPVGVLTGTTPAGTNSAATQTAASQNELQLTSVSATASAAGVLLEWRTNSTSDNVGFNVYRVKNGQRVRANKEIIPGALFAPGTPALMRAGYSYAWFDRGGTLGSTYFIESVNVDGAAKIHQAISPVAGKTPSGFEQTAAASATDSADVFPKQYPAAEAQLRSLLGTIQDQWAIAGQTSLKIGIKTDGWYRVTQEQMVAAGFNPTVDIRNLRLFVDASEVAISTNQRTGPFGSGDYIEFYGRGLDAPTTDTRTYYLIAGTTPGKRVTGELQLDGDPPGPVDPPGPSATPPPITPPVRPPVLTPITPLSPDTTGPVLRDPIFFSWVQRDFSFLMGSLTPANPPPEATGDIRQAAGGRTEKPDAISSANVIGDDAVATNNTAPEATKPVDKNNPIATQTAPGSDKNEKSLPLPVVTKTSANNTRSQSLVTRTPGKFRKSAGSRKKSRRKPRRQLRQEHNHALIADGFAATNFVSTIELKQRLIYFSNLLNGDVENFFGQVLSSAPITQTLTVQNPDLTAGPATLEFALQGVANQIGTPHQVSVAFNGVTIGSLDFSANEHLVTTSSIPIAQLQSGVNTIKFTKTSTGENCIIDYIRLTYSHTYQADSGQLKFNLRGNQTRTVDGFSTPSVRLIDYTDPLAVSISRPSAEPSASGYAVTVPVSESFSKDQRLFYAIPEGQFDQPAALSLGQPSTLNSNANASSFLVISHKNFIPSFTANVTPINTSLVAQRQSQGFSVSVVDVDDVYDEFSYGVHGPQAIRDFLQHASTHWATPPQYVVFAGDASYDPRNYEGRGDFDFVPTKLVDATFSEAVSDDWLTDFDDDGVANIPVGRMPFRTVADASLVISKIVNFTPEVNQKALLVADEDEFNIYGFVQTNDTFQSLLPASMIVQRLNRAPQPAGVPSQPSAQVRTDIIAGLNEGRALVGYAGHGNVDVWTGSSLFLSADATALTNGNKLSFVVVMDCLNGYFQDPTLLSLAEAFVKAPNGGAVAAFASSGLTFAQGQHLMGQELYTQLYGGSSIALGDAIKLAKAATFDIDVKRTWIFFGDPSMKIR